MRNIKNTNINPSRIRTVNGIKKLLIKIVISLKLLIIWEVFLLKKKLY
jgi:hypothetical protein